MPTVTTPGHWLISCSIASGSAMARPCTSSNWHPLSVNTPARTNRPAPTRDAVVARHPAQKKKLSPYDIQLQKRREEIRRLREQTYFGVPAKVHKVVEVEKPKPKPKRPVIAPSATRVPAMPKDPPIPLMPAGMETLCLRCDEVREQLHERETLRKLMLMREVLGPPLSLRKDDLLLSFPYER